MIIEKKPIKELKAAPYNPRKATEKQEANLKASLEKFGVVEPIVFNKQTGHIVGGHFRVRELKKLGVKEVECVIVDLSPEDEKELNIRLNANTGEFDWEVLNDWDKELLSDWGMDTEEKETPKKETKDTIPYKKTHILISINPEQILDIKPYLDKILEIDGIEYEQTSN
jgi:ParB-like chromosome segregation protein Spo0J